jgi:hypothetical protein
LLNNDTALAQKNKEEPELEKNTDATFTEFNLNM